MLEYLNQLETNDIEEIMKNYTSGEFRHLSEQKLKSTIVSYHDIILRLIHRIEYLEQKIDKLERERLDSFGNNKLYKI